MPSEDPRIEKAKKLKEKFNFFYNFFYKPDYIESGNLFFKVGNDSTDINEKQKYYKEAAETYAMANSKYGFFSAAEAYKAIIDLEEKQDEKENLIEYYISYSSMLEKSRNIFMAASKYMKVGEFYEKNSIPKAIHYYQKAKELLIEYGKSPEHLKFVINILISLNLELGNYEEVVVIVRESNFKYKNLCIELLLMISEKPSEEELDDPKESQIISDIINKKPNEAAKTLNDFRGNNSLPDYAKKIFLATIEKINPEYDIC